MGCYGSGKPLEVLENWMLWSGNFTMKNVWLEIASKSIILVREFTVDD